MKPGTLKQVRELAKDKMKPFDVTVITRDGNIVIRQDVGSPRHVDFKAVSMAGTISRLFNVTVHPNSFHGRKGLYTNYWAEAIIPKSEIHCLEGHLYL